MIGDSLFSDVMIQIGSLSIGGVIPDVLIEETLSDQVTITDHPVEMGAQISDHAVINPTEITLQLGWTNSKTFFQRASGGSIPDIDGAYEKLLKLKNERKPFDVITNKRTFSNMIIKTLEVTTDQRTSSVLLVKAHLRQIIFAVTSEVSFNPEGQKDIKETGQTENRGSANAKIVPDGTAGAVKDAAAKV